MDLKIIQTRDAEPIFRRASPIYEKYDFRSKLTEAWQLSIIVPDNRASFERTNSLRNYQLSTGYGRSSSKPKFSRISRATNILYSRVSRFQTSSRQDEK